MEGKFYHKRTSQKLTSFCVPHFDVSIVATTQELSAIIIEADVPHGFTMTEESSKQSSLVVHLPKLSTDEHTNQHQHIATNLITININNNFIWKKNIHNRKLINVHVIVFITCSGCTKDEANYDWQEIT